MSRYIESQPNRVQAKRMTQLGFVPQETDDSMVAVWQQGLLVLHLPAAWVPADLPEAVRRVAQMAYDQGAAAARAQIRAALNGHA